MFKTEPGFLCCFLLPILSAWGCVVGSAHICRDLSVEELCYDACIFIHYFFVPVIWFILCIYVIDCNIHILVEMAEVFDERVVEYKECSLECGIIISCDEERFWNSISEVKWSGWQ